MPLLTRAGAAPRRRFSLWMTVVWIVMLFAALGAVQYLQHADYSYLLASVAVIAVCAGCILRLRWARPTMRYVAWLLALWALVTAVLMLPHWADFDVARQHAQSQPQLRELALWMVARAQRTWEVGLALKVIAVPVLLWLSWRAGPPSERSKFPAARR
ncbi:MAG: hypothetical protein M3Y93_04670 [Pseudomonadota bacterium]|nr:hypothetical protein [Pseudomonadota bacterium]